MPTVEKKTILQDAAYLWIYDRRAGEVFRVTDVYSFLGQKFPEWRQQRGDSKWEERFQNDARWGVQRAKRDRLIEPTGERGAYRRTSRSN